jgi:cyanate permease
MSAFNGIISYGLSRLEGRGGLRGWRWVFIVPGAITVALAIPVLLFITDFPEKAKWLKGEQLALVQKRLDEDRGEDINDKITPKKAVKAFTDPKVWLMSLMLCFVTTGTYVMAFFTPSILNGLGYSVALSQILVSPPYLLAVAVSIVIAIWADRVHKRTSFIVSLYGLTMIGFAMIGWGNNIGCKYAGVFLAITGVNSVTPCVLTFLVNNVPNPSKRAIAVPLQTGFNGIGGIIGSLIFRQQDAPGYRPGLYGAFTANSLGIIITLGFIYYFRRQNERADRDGIILEGVPGFRYTL